MRHLITVLGFLLFSASAAPAQDQRELVQLPSMMRDHMLANMRDHLVALTEIQRHIATAEYDQAAAVAENRLGMSSMGSHGASHMAKFMPTGMQQIGTEMHRAASRFAVKIQEAAIEGDNRQIANGLADVMQQCVACHTAYRVHE
jgi:cytochrome c556